MSSTSSSKHWLERQKKDPYVRQAKALGMRSRAAFKLLEIQKKHQMITSGMRVLELGSAPGSWTELMAEWVGKSGKVYAIDLLDMAPIPRVEFRQDDIESDASFTWYQAIAAEGLNFIVSDMAPNMCGHQRTDQLRSAHLVEMVTEIARKYLNESGGLLIKAFHGSGFNEILKELRLAFKQVKVLKPDASRKASGEVYLLATYKKPQVNQQQEQKHDE